jgi:1-acyl-sn-glycerol-3-phosphate acyltransferase
MMPPVVVRRVLVAPLVALVDLAILVVSPFALLLAVLGGTRAVRMVLIVAAFAGAHLLAVAECFGRWARRADAHEHYDVMRRFVGRAYRAIVRIARVDVRFSPASAAAEEVLASGERPVIVLARHAGEGDTLLAAHALLCRYRRQPRVVMHHALRLDPVVDVLGSRLPNRFVDPRGGDTEVEIAAMARGLGDRDAVLIFPEGANFTAEHRARAIDRLARAGHAEEARWAREMRHVSAPRPGGALAAIGAAPGADVVVMGYVGFPCSFGELLERLAGRQTVDVRLWVTPAGEVPSDEDEAIDWLFARWRELDAWIDSA